RRGRGEGRGESSEMLPPRRQEEAPPPELESEFDLDRDEELDLERALDEEFPDQPRLPEERESPPAGDREEREPRRRRRGGRRRGGRDRDEAAAERSSGFGAPEADEQRPAARPVQDSEPADQLDEHDDLDSAEGDEEHVSGVPTHKKIPTWEEAVGLLIESNMAGRASGPDRDPYRGRGRGGRGRGGRR
ncbi:MAG TPA: hypothetical protein VFB80_02270, partial [Pirellulaceae bacterium]|nr:hypothetical protein [Pirellulaceae bacterium]